jgi:2-methylcitrate dehydratase PrpD
MGTVLGMMAVFRRAGMKEFKTYFNDPRIAAFREKVFMVLDPEVDQMYPQVWIGKVTVETADGRTLLGRVTEPKGDPGNSLTRNELEQKALRLAEFSGMATAEEMSAVIARIWNITRLEKVGRFLA